MKSGGIGMYQRWVGFVFVSLTLVVSLAQSEEPKQAESDYQGPLILFVFDKDHVLNDGTGIELPVFLWQEATSPISDSVRLKLPKQVDVPMHDWEFGVKSEIPQYNMTPIKKLVGSYADGAQTVRNPGNSYYGKPILLSNGQLLYPEKYFIDPYKTHAYFRTDVEAGHKPLVETVRKMIEKKAFGPAFPLFALSTRKDFPAATMILTLAGNENVEWVEAHGLLQEAGALAPDSKVDRVFAINNPNLTISDPTSTSQFGRMNVRDRRKKIQILEYLIDNVLSRRIDRERPNNPRPNVLIFAEDNIEILKEAKELFERKVGSIQNFDGKMNVGHPPIRLILINYSPDWYYADQPNVFATNPAALANKPIDLETLMVFDSDYRNQRGQLRAQKIKPKDLLAVALGHAIDVPETQAKQMLSNPTTCEIALNREGNKK